MESTTTQPQATATPQPTSCAAPAPANGFNVIVTDKAASEVKRIISQQRESGSFPADQDIYLRLSVVGGGCSGFQHKLDLRMDYNEKLDNRFDVDGVSVIIDKRSSIYLEGATVDFHDDLNKRGFSITNPSAKSTCGCGSSFSM